MRGPRMRRAKPAELGSLLDEPPEMRGVGDGHGTNGVHR